MELIEIDDNTKTVAGEYIYHAPTDRVVMCGSIDKNKNQIVALAGSNLFVDKINNFKKIKLSQKERQERIARRRCRSCGR